jgi:hypothetical protein
MDMIVIGGVVTGLVMGSFGYVLARFGIRPLLRYRRFKHGLAGLLDTLLKTQAISTEVRDTLQRTAVELQDMVDAGLPRWYIMALHKKEEQPQDAVRHLQTLANCKAPEAIRQRVTAVQNCLRLV